MNNRDYIESKIDHMKRAGLVIGKHNGLGKHGGACPTWLRDFQRNDQKARRGLNDSSPKPVYEAEEVIEIVIDNGE